MVSISGALIVTLYKGPVIGGGMSAIPYPDESLSTSQPSKTLLADIPNWVIGGMFLAAAGLSLATWNTAQVVCELSLLFLREMGLTDFFCSFKGSSSEIISIGGDLGLLLLLLWDPSVCSSCSNCRKRSKSLESKAQC